MDRYGWSWQWRRRGEEGVQSGERRLVGADGWLAEEARNGSDRNLDIFGVGMSGN